MNDGVGRTYLNLPIEKSDRISLEEIALQDRAENSSTEQRLAQRAKMILACGEGKKIADIAAELGVRPNTVIDWRERYRESGLAGLFDRKKSGRSSKFDDSFRNRVLEKLNEVPPAGQDSWDGIALAEALNVPPAAVWEVLRKEGISLVRRRVWEIPAVSPFGTVLATVAGVFLSPSRNAFVLLTAVNAAHQEAVGKLVLPNKNAYKSISRSCNEDGTITLHHALEYSRNAPFTENIGFDGFEQFIEKVTENRESAHMLAIIDGGALEEVNLRWKIEHPHFTFRHKDHAGWRAEVELICEALLDQEGHLLSDLMEECAKHQCRFEWVLCAEY